MPSSPGARRYSDRAPVTGCASRRADQQDQPSGAALGAGRRRVVERLSTSDFNPSKRLGRAAIPARGCPIARRQVNSACSSLLREAVRLSLRRHLVGKKVPDGGEPGVGGRVEAVEEPALGEHHRSDWRQIRACAFSLGVIRAGQRGPGDWA